MKKGKLNNKGFVLVETLIVSVFIAAIFAILYNNFYPLMGEYEKREVYDDIDGKYATYWIKRIIQHSQTDIGDDCKLDKLKTAPYHCKFSCDMAGNDSMKAMCKQLVEKSQIYVKDGEPSIYITTYNLAQFKEYVNENFTKLNRFTDVTDSSKWYFYDVNEAANEHIGITHSDGETWSK